MFLLIQKRIKELERRLQDFTFHNVSINTKARTGHKESLEQTLHSTMFLLIRIEDLNVSGMMKNLYIPQCFY